MELILVLSAFIFLSAAIAWAFAALRKHLPWFWLHSHECHRVMALKCWSSPWCWSYVCCSSLLPSFWLSMLTQLKQCHHHVSYIIWNKVLASQLHYMGMAVFERGSIQAGGYKVHPSIYVQGPATRSTVANILSKLSKWPAISLYNNVPFIFECFHDQQDSWWHKKSITIVPTWKLPKA